MWMSPGGPVTICSSLSRTVTIRSAPRVDSRRRVVQCTIQGVLTKDAADAGMRGHVPVPISLHVPLVNFNLLSGV